MTENAPATTQPVGAVDEAGQGHARHQEAWNWLEKNGCLSHRRLVNRARAPFSVRPLDGPSWSRGPLTMALEHEIRRLVEDQRKSKLSGGGPRMARPRWW